MNQAHKHLLPIKAPKKGRLGGQRSPLGQVHTAPPEAYKKPRGPGPQQKPCKDDGVAPKPGTIKRLQDTARLCPRDHLSPAPGKTDSSERPSWLWFPGYRNVMFWLPVKGLAQWRHTSFPVLSFLPLRRLYVFPRVHSLTAQGPRRCRALAEEARGPGLRST